MPSGLDERSLRVRLVLAQPTAMELLRVLAYPTFRLEPIDRDRLLEDLLPWCESWGAAIPSSRQRGRDPHDQVFLDLALKEEVVPLQIVNPAEAMAADGLSVRPSLEGAGPCRGMLAAVAHHQFAGLDLKGMAPRSLGTLRL